MRSESRQSQRSNLWRSGALLVIVALAVGAAASVKAQTADSCATNISFILDRPDFSGVIDHYVVTGEREVRNLYTMNRIGNDTYIILSNIGSVFSPDTAGLSVVVPSDTLLVASPTPPTGFDLLEKGREVVPADTVQLIQALDFDDNWFLIALGQSGVGAIEASEGTLGAAQMKVEPYAGITWDVTGLPYRISPDYVGPVYTAHVYTASGSGGMNVLDLETQNRFLIPRGHTDVPGDARAIKVVATSADTLAMIANGRGVWVYRSDLSRPATTQNASAGTLDPTTQTMYLFPANFDLFELQTWTLTLADHRWHRLTTSGPTPPPTSRSRAVYDPVRHGVVLYGGVLANPWELDTGTKTWSELVPTIPPPDGNARYGASVVYDAGRDAKGTPRDRLIVFGGQDYEGFGAPPHATTWAFNFADSSWHDLVDTTAAPHPAARAGAGAVFVPGSELRPGVSRPDRMFLFGGEDLQSGIRYSDLWVFNLETDRWSQVLTSGFPPPQSSEVRPGPYANQFMMYDQGRDRIVMYGDTLRVHGTTDPTFVQHGNIWQMNLAAVAPESTSLQVPVLEWQHYEPPFLTLLPRIDMVAVPDSARDGVLIFGGQDSSGYKQDLQFLNYSTNQWSEVLPTVTEFVDSLATAGSAEGIAVSGDKVFVADGLAGVTVARLGRLTNPADPTFELVDMDSTRAGVQSLTVPGYARSVTTRGPYLYVAAETGGVRVWRTDSLTLDPVAAYPGLHAVRDIFPVGWGVSANPTSPVPADSAYLFVSDDNAYTILLHQRADSLPPFLATAPVEKAGLPGRFSVYAVASECLAPDTLFTHSGIEYAFRSSASFDSLVYDSAGTRIDSVRVTRADTTSFRTLSMGLIDAGRRFYGSTATLDIIPVLDSLAVSLAPAPPDSGGITGQDLYFLTRRYASDTRLVFRWSARDASPAGNVGSGEEEISVGTVLGEIGGTLLARTPGVSLDVPAHAYSGRRHFYFLEESARWRAVQGGSLALDPLSGTPDPALAGLEAAGGWCRTGWTGGDPDVPFLLHMPVSAAPGGAPCNDAAIYRLDGGSWMRAGGEQRGNEIVAAITAPGLYRVLHGRGGGTPIVASSLLDQNAPNPFNPRTVIRYRLPAAGAARLAVYDVNGRLVRTLAKGYQPAGETQVTWLGDDDHGKAVASGVYFYRLEAAGRTESRKMVLIR